MTTIFIRGALNFDLSGSGKQRRVSGYETFYHPRTGTFPDTLVPFSHLPGLSNS